LSKLCRGMVLGQETRKPLASHDAAIEEARGMSVGLGADLHRRAPRRRLIRSLFQFIGRTDHPDDAISDDVTPVDHEIGPKIFLNRPFGRRLPSSWLDRRSIRKAHPTGDNFLDETRGVWLAQRVRAGRAPFRTFDLSL